VVWVANRADGTVSRIDPATNRVVGKPVRVGAEPFALAARGRRAWVTCLGNDTLVRVTAR
jgi:YVTN family beta-propeller protein